MPRPAVFVDRDGTINVEVDYLSRMDELTLYPGAADALARLAAAGYRIVVVTNQSGVARGFFTERRVKRVHQRLRKLLRRAAGVRLDAIFYCPFYPKGRKRYRLDSPDRKPAPGMLLKGARLLDLDLARSFMVGDRRADVEAGHNAGCRSVLVETGYGKHEKARVPEWTVKPGHVAVDLAAAADWILAQGAVK